MSLMRDGQTPSKSYRKNSELAATDHGEFITLVAGNRRSLLMAGKNDEVYDKKPQRYAEDNCTQW